MCLITKLPQCGAISVGLQGCCQSCCWQQFSEAFVPVSVNLPSVFKLRYHGLFTSSYCIAGAPCFVLHQFCNLLSCDCKGVIFLFSKIPLPTFTRILTMSHQSMMLPVYLKLLFTYLDLFKSCERRMSSIFFMISLRKC